MSDDRRSRFHLAMPVHDLAVARDFYGGVLRCPEGRSSDSWVDFDLYGHQFVAHLFDPAHRPSSLTNPVDGDDVPVPHFGVLLSPADWQELADRLTAAETSFVIEPHTRFAGQIGEQSTMFLLDPSGTRLEFKAFADDSKCSHGDACVTVRITDVSDRRLDDYRSLNDQAFRRRYEADRCFIVEGYVAIDRLIESGHTIRSALLAPSRVDRFVSRAGVLAAAQIPVYVADRDVIADVVGFDLHRGVIACADRRPHPSVEGLLTGSRRIAVLEGLNDAENLGAIARAARGSTSTA